MPNDWNLGLTDYKDTASFPDFLSSRSTTSNVGFLPSGGSGASSGGGSTGDWGGAVGAFAPLLLSAFGNNEAKGKATESADLLSTLSKALNAQGGSLAGQGQNALGPVMKYLMAVAGGDPTSLLNATAPERARVIDQYDTARRSIQFAPRGGGQATAGTNLETKKASDLGTLTATARREGVKELGSFGSNLLQQGLGAEEAGARGTAEAAGIYGRQAAEQDQELASFGKALGSALPFIIAAL